MQREKLIAHHWEDYELIDAGGGKKLERWGNIITIRPEVQAYFMSKIPFKKWYELAHWEFLQNTSKGKWKKLKEQAPEHWTISYKNFKFNLSLSKFKHVGIFPEQVVNWDFIAQHLKKNDRFLNLFAYTGAASLVARYAGSETFHVDSVKQIISKAKQNMESSRLLNIKWVHEDALKFANREWKRGNHYQGIIMDPPAWGIGAKGEKWKLEEKLDELLNTAGHLISTGGFLILNTYSPQVTIDYLNEMAEIYFPTQQKLITELWMDSTSGNKLYFGNLLRIQF